MNTAPRILVIEDNEVLRDIILQILEIENYETHLAADGEEGLALARSISPDLILCDIAMPKLTGYEVLRALRTDPATATTPFIFLTAKAERSDLRAGMDLGADDYLTKPFDSDELLAAVRTRLRKQESTRTATQHAAEQRQSDLLLNLPHEIRTPLSGILGLAQLLVETDFTAEERRSMITDILASGRRLERTLTNLLLHLELELARHSSEGSRRFRARAPAQVAQALSAAVTAKSEEYARTVSLNVSPDNLLAAIDAPYLTKMTEELLDNALRFSPIHQPVRVIATKIDGEILVEVSDRGPGMTAEDISKVQAYRKFDRVQRRQEGLGIGLAITRHLAELNHGSIALATQPTGGLIATLRLPAAS